MTINLTTQRRKTLNMLYVAIKRLEDTQGIITKDPLLTLCTADFVFISGYTQDAIDAIRDAITIIQENQ